MLVSTGAGAIRGAKQDVTSTRRSGTSGRYSVIGLTFALSLAALHWQRGVL